MGREESQSGGTRVVGGGGWGRGSGHSACWVSSTGSGMSVDMGTLSVIDTDHRDVWFSSLGASSTLTGTGAGLGVAGGHRWHLYSAVSLSLLLDPRGTKRQFLWL